MKVGILILEQKQEHEISLNEKEVFEFLIDVENALFDLRDLKRKTGEEWFMIITERW